MSHETSEHEDAASVPSSGPTDASAAAVPSPAHDAATARPDDGGAGRGGVVDTDRKRSRRRSRRNTSTQSAHGLYPGAAGARAAGAGDESRTPSPHGSGSPARPGGRRSSRRERAVRDFIRRGEDNVTFHNKAPSILQVSSSPVASSPQLQPLLLQASQDAIAGPLGLPSTLPGSSAGDSASELSSMSLGGGGADIGAFSGISGISGASGPPGVSSMSNTAGGAGVSGASAAGAGFLPGSSSSRVHVRPAEQWQPLQSSHAMDDTGLRNDREAFVQEVHRADEQEEEDTDDFVTVDWARDRDRYLRHEKEQETHFSYLGDLKRYTYRGLSRCQGWLICVLVGVCTGTLAAVIDIAVHWAIDLKTGYCKGGWYLDYAFCCGTKTDIVNSQADCLSWVKWSDALEMGALSDYATDYGMYTVMATFMGGMSAWLVVSYAPYASGSGIPEIKTILGGVIIKRYLGFWTLLIKCVGLVMSVGSGMSLGKEGPLVHIGSCFANILSRYFPKYKDNDAKKNEILSAAAAAGVSVAFGAPIGGVLFSLEEVSTYFPHKTMWRSFFCAIIASLTLKYIDPLQTGKLVLFQIDYNISWAWVEMVPFALLGVIGGLVGVVFIRLNLRVASFRKHTVLRKYSVLEVGSVACITAIISYNSDFLQGSDNAVLALLFQKCGGHDPLHLCHHDDVTSAALNMLLVASVTLFLTIFTFGSKAPAGVFIPSLLTGAAIGRLLGTLIRHYQYTQGSDSLFHCDTHGDPDNCIAPGIYALVGAAAVLGGVTRMTISLVVIMFELTGGLSYILPIMVAIMISKWIGDAYGRSGLYDCYIDLHAYPFMEAEHHVDLHTLAEDVMTKDLIVLTMHGHTMQSLVEQVRILKKLGVTGFPIVTSTSDMLIVGYITRAELQRCLREEAKRRDVSRNTRCYFAMVELRFPKNAPYVDMTKWLDPCPVQITETTPLHRIYNLFKQLGLRYVLVTRFGRVVGIITKKDVLQYFHDQHRHQEGEGDRYREDEGVHPGWRASVTGTPVWGRRQSGTPGRHTPVVSGLRHRGFGKRSGGDDDDDEYDDDDTEYGFGYTDDAASSVTDYVALRDGPETDGVELDTGASPNAGRRMD